MVWGNMFRQSSRITHIFPQQMFTKAQQEKISSFHKKLHLADFALFLDDKYSKIERIIWFVVYLVVFGLSSFVCYQLATTYMNSPIVVSVEPEDGGSMGKYFPAVTICNIRKWLARGVQGEDIGSKIKLILERRNRAMPHCSWKSRTYKCAELFRMVLTDWETFCYTFNYEFPEKYSAARVYLGDNFTLENDTWSMRYVAGLGVNNGISVILDILKQENGGVEHARLINNRRECLGFMVLVHSPEEFPVMTSKSVHVTPGLENNILIEMSKIHTTESVFEHPFARKRKNCYEEGEKPLAYFHRYSSTACKVECVINRTLVECGCRHWTAPGLAGERVCIEDVETECYMNVSNSMRQNDTDTYIQHWEKCDCKNRCDYTSYSFTVSTALLDAKSVAERFNQTEEYSRYNMVIVNVFFGNSRVMAYRREVLSNIPHLCSNIGGIIGAILGWSLFTVVKSFFAFIFHYKWTKNSTQNQIQKMAYLKRKPELDAISKNDDFVYMPGY